MAIFLLLLLSSWAHAAAPPRRASEAGRAPTDFGGGISSPYGSVAPPRDSARSAPPLLEYNFNESFDSIVRTEKENARYALLDVRFPSPVTSRFKANNTVWGHLYLPKKPRHGTSAPPCILVLPVMAAPNVWIETRFMNAFVGQGYAVLWIEMPYQFHRVPAPLAPSGQAFLSRTLKGLSANFRQSVSDARRAVTWLERSTLVDPSRIAVFGISLGAIVGSTTLSMDPRLRGGVFLLGGADFPSLVFSSEMTRPYARKLDASPQALKEAWRGLDPLDYKRSNRGKSVFLINALSDHVIPKANALALRDAFPDGQQIWVPFGHYSSIVHLVWIRRYVGRQFDRIFGDKK